MPFNKRLRTFGIFVVNAAVGIVIERVLSFSVLMGVSLVVYPCLVVAKSRDDIWRGVRPVIKVRVRLFPVHGFLLMIVEFIKSAPVMTKIFLHVFE